MLEPAAAAAPTVLGGATQGPPLRRPSQKNVFSPTKNACGVPPKPTRLHKDEWVWVPDDEHWFLPAQVINRDFDAGEGGEVALLDGTSREVTPLQSKEILWLDRQILETEVHDMVNINDLKAHTMLHNLRKRFHARNIYSHVRFV